jgi:hypothetical protein
MYTDLAYSEMTSVREPSAKTRFREEYYLKAEPSPKAPVRPSQERGLAAFLRAHTMLSAGRFVPLI